jgi:hypothetical protein
MQGSARLLPAIVVLALAALLQCCKVGPQSVSRDRFDYNTAISNSWKEQSLLNIVKIRYADMPLFIEVASVVAGYTLETSLAAGAALPATDTFGGNTFTAGVTGRFIDRPTITYAPITGQQFNRSFMTPIPPQAILFLMQSGWPADLVLPVAVDSMNGLRAQIAAGARQRQGDQGYYRAIKLLRQIQDSGAVGMRIQKAGEKETTMLLFHRDGVSPEVEKALEELRGLLKMDASTIQMRVTYSQIAEEKDDLAMLTRSMFQIMVDIATQVEVPEEHVAEGRTPPSLQVQEGEEDPRTLRIHHSSSHPGDAFVAVRYRDYWFYIDDRDFKSKRTFTFLMVLFSLTETGGREALPLVTIPAG